MHFKLNLRPDAEELVIYSENEKLNERWSVLTLDQMSKKTGTKWNWFGHVIHRKGERTKLHCGYDAVVKRPVVLKTLFYRANDLTSYEAIEQRREVLREQIRILNDINSPLLPEPLDWFHVENKVERMPQKLRDTEPVLVLDYLPGKGLETFFRHNRLRFKNSAQHIDIPKIARIMLKFLQFLRVLDEKGYGYLDFRPEHVLFLKNEVPRFIGIGSICPVKRDGTLDENHINFSRTTKGYAAPELLNSENNWASSKCATPSQIAAFSLGVMLHQLIMESKEFMDGTIKNGSFFYPNEVSEAELEKKLAKNYQYSVTALIRDLCKENPQERLTDYDVIEERLHEIASSVFTKFVKKKKQQQYEEQKRRYEEMKARKDEERRKLERIQAEKVRQEAARREREALERAKAERTKAERLKREEEEKKKGWCFLSTAAYGTSTHPNLDVLRTFRDDVLTPVPLGRKMLAHYKKNSPKISHLLRGMPVRKAIVRKVIDLTVVTVRKSLEKGTAWDAWAYVSIVLYYIVFALSFVFVLPEKLLGIQTTTDRGEHE